MTGNSLETVGFITNSEYPMSGASTDSLVNDDGVLEVKCFDDKKHFQIIIEYNKRGTFKIESGYIWQVQMELLITERDWCDFVVYNPNYDDEIFIIRVYPDEEMQQKIKDGIIKGVKMYTEMEKEYLNK
jgi:exodeoxyribonuclease (lambda-induced)